MDPLTIIATCVGLGEAAAKVTKVIAMFLNGVSSADDDLNDLLSEVESLGDQTSDIRICFGRKQFIGALQESQANWGSNITTSLHKTLQDCTISINKLGQILDGIKPPGKDANLMRRGLAHWRLDVKSEEIMRVRAQIHGHKTTLQLSLQVIHL